MHRLLNPPLKFASGCGDTVAKLVRHRFVRDKDLGIAHGEAVLRQLTGYLNIDMVFDVGANVGQYARQLRTKVLYQGNIVSFEPLPQAALQLRNLASNDLRWSVHECALDEVPGKAQFNVMAGDQFSSLLEPSAEFEGRFHGQHIHLRSGSRYCRGYRGHARLGI